MAKVPKTDHQAGRRLVSYRRGDTVYAQGSRSDVVLEIQTGGVRLAVTSPGGKEAIVAVLGEGDFCGEGALAAERIRATTAIASVDSRIMVIPKAEMTRLLREEPAFAARFLTYLLARNRRLEDDLVDQLLHASEQRLARTLLLLAGSGRNEPGPRSVPPIPQEIIAEMIGTTRSRVNFLMNKFRKNGLIDYDAQGLKVHDALREMVS